MKSFKIILEHNVDQETAIEKIKQLKILGKWKFDSKIANPLLTHEIKFIEEYSFSYIRLEVSSYLMDIKIKIDEKFIEIEGNALHMVREFSNAIQSAFVEALNLIFVKKTGEIKEGE